MAEKPLFSVIIPTYNRAGPLRRALDSLVRQTNQEFEVIVSDDGSTDDSRQMAASFSGRLQITYAWNPNWGGPARPRNSAIAIAAGEWLCFLDSDDWWYPQKLAEIKTRLSDSDVIFHDLDRYHSFPGEPRAIVKGRFLPSPIFLYLMLYGNVLPNSSVAVRKSLVVEAGCFAEDRSLIAAEDFDLWLRIARLTNRFTYVPVSLGGYWVGVDNITESGTEREAQRFSEVYSRHLKFLEGDDRVHAELSFAYRCAAINLKMGRMREAVDLCRAVLAGKPGKAWRWFIVHSVKECFSFALRQLGRLQCTCRRAKLVVTRWIDSLGVHV